MALPKRFGIEQGWAKAGGQPLPPAPDQGGGVIPPGFEAVTFNGEVVTFNGEPIWVAI